MIVTEVVILTETQPEEELMHLACCYEVDRWLAGGPKPKVTFCGFKITEESRYGGSNVDNCSLCELEHQLHKTTCPILGIDCENMG